MTSSLTSRSMPWLFFAALSAGLAVPGHAAKKTTYETFVAVPAHRFQADGICGDLSGTATAGKFLKGFQRIETEQGVEFRRKSKVVREFPDEIDFSLEGAIGSCPASLPNSATSAELNDFVDNVRVTADWTDGATGSAVSNLSVTKIPPIVSWFREYEQPRWGLSIRIPANGVSISNALNVSVISESGHKVMNFTFAL
jgi:hypothetical protein